MVLQYRLPDGDILSINLTDRTAYELSPRPFTEAARYIARHLNHLSPVSLPLPAEAIPAVLAALAGDEPSSPVQVRRWTNRPYLRLLP